MITPLDIQNKNFAKAMRGYNEDEVDAFLDLLIVDYEKLMDDNETLRRELAEKDEELQKYKGTEDMVLETLGTAKSLMNDISSSAEKRAEILVKNAELDAQLITRQAREAVERLKEEEMNLSMRLADVRIKFKNLLESELERFDVLSQEIFKDIQKGSAARDTKDIEKGDAAPREDSEDFTKTMVNIRGIDK